ncbi:MAG TPA: tRNA guanosine(34) transglycosylase Tgt [Bacteroidales bacterium]|nr:tRNA guanosine(34) transglycosylase Tgt [Bacteroidales bacterium]HRT90521.1 tRNA guanosine(34) transglycosylase Tgt [Bacteroidales bacterium]
MFTVTARDKQSRARTGILRTAHGDISTPVFMPVGTAGTVKGILQRDLESDIDAKIILGNTYHLYLRPGMQIMKDAGGLHRFMNWQRALLTDSGGYQIFSLSKIRKITDEGVTFTSHVDGSKHLFTPENTVDIQRIIGADIMMVLDECTPYPCDHRQASRSLTLTEKWLDRAFERYRSTEPLWGYHQALFPIVQGSVYEDLRQRSAEKAASAGAEGIAIGGLSVGEPAEIMYRMTEVVTGILPEDKPRYLMGVGTPENILESIALGIDMFDCVMPTRNGRNGMLFTRNGIINIRNRKWADDFTPVDVEGASEISRSFSKAYLRHLFVSGEMLGPQIASINNVSFYMDIVREARQKIEEGTFQEWKKETIKKVSARL